MLKHQGNAAIHAGYPRRVYLQRMLHAAGGALVWAVAPAGLVAPVSAVAAVAADGPARVRGLAARSNVLDVVQLGAAGDARQSGRLVAVGERGHVLLSDDVGKTWRQAKSVPTRSTLTALCVTDAGKTLWACGHGGTLLRSEDAGETWVTLKADADPQDVFLSVLVTADGRGLAVGGFGLACRTKDGGKTWQRDALIDGEAGEKHMNRILVTAKGTWLVAAEGGVVLRSDDQGASFKAFKTPYNGSLWCGAALADGRIVIGGMRGNLVTSVDDGRQWSHTQVAQAGSLTAAAVLADQRLVLVGVDGTVVVSQAAGWQFQRLDDRATVTGVVAVAADRLIVSTQLGLREVKL